MEYNPLTPHVRSRREDLDKLRKTENGIRSKLAWHDAFDAPAAALTATQEEAKAADLTGQVAETEKDLADAKERVDRLRPATLLGWNLHHWFSEVRSTAIKELAQCGAEIERSEADIRRNLDNRDRALAHAADARDSLERYSQFDRDDVEGDLAKLATEIEQSSADFDKCEARKKKIERELEVPMRELLSLQSRLDNLKSELAKANQLDHRLAEADTRYEGKQIGYQKAQIHEECKRTFGISSPTTIIEKTERAIASEERNIAKLERRLQEIGRRGSLDVHTLVIDGSNLCYEGDKLIGLFALRALWSRLANDFKVIVVFDASIVEKLDLPSDDVLRSQLPGMNVHIVSSPRGADETILDAAQDPKTFVVSRDRFVDFPDKPAVRDDRLLRHEIVNDHVFVHDLSIDVEFSNRR